uniref:Candidate secreted effector n=1 Tax=Meloidogyne incognita TaxID=6306 RepID=A0A914NC45_MELIC
MENAVEDILEKTRISHSNNRTNGRIRTTRRPTRPTIPNSVYAQNDRIRYMRSHSCWWIMVCGSESNIAI